MHLLVAKRRKDREEAYQKAVAAEKAGDSRAARRFYAQSCSVTHKIRYLLIQAAKQARVAFIVAPYEADAQMARLANTGVVDLVITEDSDILAYGCPRALFKIDFDTCQGEEIQLMKDLGANESLSFKSWTHDMFVFMCILSGCDYSKGITGLGLKRAHKIVRLHRNPSNIFCALRIAGKMPRGFEDEFWVAFRTFRHQRVFCPSKQQIEPLYPIPGSAHDSNPLEVWPFLGEYIEPRIAAQIANGTLHPSTKMHWDVARKGSTMNKSFQSNKIQDIEIHHRSHPKQRKKDNVWHAMVYGNQESGGSIHNPHVRDQSDYNSTKQRDTSKDDMFRFFSKKDVSEKRDRDSLESTDSRPPLKEIYVDESINKPMPILPPPPGHRDLPIHFHEYKSHLVGNKFEPISRKRMKHGNAGTRSTEVVKKIWKSASFKAPPVQDDCEADIKRVGIGMFSRKNHPLVFVPPQPLAFDESYFTFGGGVSSSQHMHRMDETINHQQQFLRQRHSSDKRSSSESPYTKIQDVKYRCSSNDTRSIDHVSSNQQYHHGDHKRNHDRHGTCDEISHTSSYSARHHESIKDRSHHHELKSLASITVEPQSCTTASSTFEYPAFPLELESNACDFGDSLQAVLTDVEQETHHNGDISNICDDHTDDYYKSVDNVFQIFQTQVGDSETFHDPAESFDPKKRFPCKHTSPSRDRVELFDDRLLMAFEEMHQL